MSRRAARSHPRYLIALAFAFTGFSATSLAQPTQTSITVTGDFEGKEGERAKDLSGIACLPITGGERTCLVANDESPFLQFATLHDQSIRAGRKVDLIESLGASLADARPPAGVFGTESSAAPVAAGRCPDRRLDKDFDEFDAEGVTWAPAASGGGAFYVTGSHACGRSNRSRRRSTHLLARIPTTRSGEPTGAAELTWRLGETLREQNDLKPFYGLPLDANQQGLDIEGLAVLPGSDELLFGLRSPSLGNNAIVFRVNASDLFSQEPGRAPPGRTSRIPLGASTGVRDLAALPDGRLLVLSGPAQAQEGIPQQLLLVHPTNEPEWPVQATLLLIEPRSAGGKAEGLTVLSTSGGILVVLVLFEDPRDDPPTMYTMKLPN
jgi:hypothetical protein